MDEALKLPMVPDFIIIGAMKAGTTSLHLYLDAHPEICMSRRKDTNFFAPRYNWDKGLDWYRSLFADPTKVVGETSVGYAQYPNVGDVPKNLHAVNAEARIVYVVRDPIRRILSHYVHNVVQGRERRGIAEALTNLDRNHYLNTSLYFMQIKQYLARFDRSRILILDHHALATRRRITLRRTFAFLGVDDGFESPVFDRVLHRTADLRQSTPFGRVLERVPVLRRLKSRIPGSGRPVPTPAIGDHLRRALSTRLTEDIQRLRALTGEQYETWEV